MPTDVNNSIIISPADQELQQAQSRQCNHEFEPLMKDPDSETSPK